MSTPKQTKQYFNYLDGKECSCPYCHAKFIWPPEKLCCPKCNSTIRPPVGYSSNTPKDKGLILKRIEREYEKELRKLGPRRNVRIKNNPKILFAIVVGFLCLGFLTISQAHRAQPKNMPGREEVTINDLNILAQALVLYKIDNGNYPLDNSNDGGLTALVTVPPGAQNWNGPYVNALHVDGWGRPYIYELVDGEPRIVSMGPDRTYNTEDDLFIDDFSNIQPRPDFVPFDPEANDRPIPSSRLRVKIAN